jgi:hypothetical protein
MNDVGKVGELVLPINSSLLQNACNLQRVTQETGQNSVVCESLGIRHMET